MTNENNTKKTKKDFIHALAGPEVLPPDAIKDIVESRLIKNAINVLHDRYGISTSRIRKIWMDYYGGGKISDVRSGLKKPLPTEPILNKDLTIRKIRTARAEYLARKPETTKFDAKSMISTKRAEPVRKILIANQSKPNSATAPPTLDIHNTDSITDEQAEILAGEVNAGNNSAELLAAIEQLILTNQNLSEHAIQALKQSIKHTKKSRSKYSETDTDETSTDQSETDETDNDDSTAAYRTNTRDNIRSRIDGDGPTKRMGKNNTLHENDMGRNAIASRSNRVNSGRNGIHARRPRERTNGVQGDDGCDSGSGGEEYEDYIDVEGHSGKVPHFEYDTISRRIPTYATHDGNQRDQKSGNRPRRDGEVGNGLGAPLFAVSGTARNNQGISPTWVPPRRS